MKLTIRVGLVTLLTAFIGGVLALTFANLTFGQAVVRPKIDQFSRLKPSILRSRLGYKMKRLATSVVDFEPLENKYQQGGHFAAYYGSGSAFIALTADDKPALPVNVEPVFTLYPDKGNDAFVELLSGPSFPPFGTAGPTFAANGACWFEYRGSSSLHRGNRALIYYNKKTGMVKVMLAKTQVNSQTSGVTNGVTSGLFLLHIELMDDDQKTCYFGDTMIRLYGFVDVNVGTPLMQAFLDMEKIDSQKQPRL